MLNKNSTRPKLCVVTAVGRDGLDTRVLTTLLHILSDDPAFDAKSAVQAACTEYVATPNGRITYDVNCGNFDWTDFITSCPNKICRKHGFEKLNSMVSNLDVNLNEHLVDDFAIQEADSDARER